MAQIIQTTFQFKRGDAERWNELNPILAEGEPGFELDTNKFKIGNGINTWKELPYKGEGNIVNAQTHNDFPTHGNENAIYKAQEEKLLYQWNPNISEYEVLGTFEETGNENLITVDTELSASSMNPVANKVITIALQDFVEDHYTKQEVDTAIENTNKRIDLLGGTTHFRGMYPNLNDENLNADLYEFSAGDIFIVENAEYICTTNGNLALLEKANYEKLGDVTAEVERISVLEEKVGNEKDGDMEATGLYQTVASLENNKLDKTALNNYYRKEETYNTTEIDSLLQEIDNREEVITLGELVDTIIGDDVGLSMRTVAVAVVAEIVGKAPEAFDTLEEIAAWIEAHPDDVAAIIKRISDLEASIDKKVDKTDIINTLDSTALDKPLSAAMGRQLNSLIEELSNAVNGKVTETQVTTAISNALKDYSTTTAMQTAINTALADYIKQTELNGAINTALQTAKESGEFNGEDGVGIESIVQTNTSTTDGGENIITVTLTDGNAPTFKVKNGTKGDNGVSPTVTVTEIERGHRLTLVDANGTQTFDVLNGENTVDSATSEEVARMKEQQPNLFMEAVQTGNLIDISMMHDGGRVQSDGTINTANSASFSYSDFVDISKAVGTHLAIYVMHKSFASKTAPAEYLNYAQAVYRMCFYDADKVKVSYAEVGGGKIADGSTVDETNRAKAILEIPANAVYVRVSYTSALTTSSINKYMVVRGDEADLNPLPPYSEYEPAREAVVVPEDLNEQLDKLRGMGRYKHQDNAVQTVTSLNNSATFSENGITFVGDELWMMKDDASYTNGTRIHRYHVDGDIFSYLGYIDGDFGHLNTMDYCAANDCFIFGNGGNDEVTTGNYFVVVKNPLTIPYNTTTTIAELVAAGQAIKYDLDSTIGSIGFKVQALWGDSNLGVNNRVILIASNATVIKEVLLSKTDGEFDGGISVLRSFTGMKTFGVQDADIWGDILYIGGQGQVGEPGRYLICEVSLTDPTKRNIIARDFYMEDGTPLTGCIQGIYVDADSIWIAVNAPSTQSPQVAITRYNRFDSISSTEAGAGVGIKSITKTATSGLIDTYTITFTDDTTATFTVTNGEAGATYTPYVATDGTLYWTNDGDLPNPDPVNLIELMRDELGLEEDAGEAVEYESFATEDELVAGGDTTKVYVVEETGTLWAYQEVEVGEVRTQIFDPESKIVGHMSGTKISSSTNELYLLPVDTSQIPEGEVAYLEVNGIYKKTSSTAPQSQKIGYSALTPDSIAVAENQLIKCFYTETRAAAGTDYPTEEEVAETSVGITVKVGYFSGSILDGYDTIKTMLIETVAIADASSITAYLVYDGGTTKQWVDTGESPPAPGTNTNYTDLLLRVNQAEADISLHDARITELETQSESTETFDDYWQDAYDAAVAKVKAKQDEGGVNVECFVWFSDFHYYSNTSSKHLLNVGRLSAAIMDECDIPFAVLSGDTLTAATLETEALVRQALQGAMSLLSPIGEERILLARGNHDDVYGRTYNEDGTTNVTYVNKVSSAVTYNELHRWQAKDYRRVFGDESGTYFYIDTPQHTRHIILNCQYYDGGSITNGTTKAMTTGMGEAQLAWLKDKALAVEDGVTVTITLHVPPTSQDINGHTYWIDGWPDDASAFRTIIQESTADIAAIFCGHCHADAVVTGDLRCPIITTTCAINTPYDADPATRVIGTDTETAINIVCINKGTRKIDAIRLGYGADRLNIAY